MFVKGQSGNPGGRPPMPEQLAKKIRDQAPDIIKFWIDTYKDKSINWKFRNKAAENLIAYGYGKAKEIIDMDIAGELSGFTINIVKKTDA